MHTTHALSPRNGALTLAANVVAVAPFAIALIVQYAPLTHA
jgi:hypothetical protein